jgi:hypothetical protein
MTDREHAEILALMGATVLVSAYAVWATRRDILAGRRLGTLASASLLAWCGLFAVGVFVASLAYAAADHLLRPLVQSVIGPPERSDYDTPSLVRQQVLAPALALTVAALLAGLVVGRWRSSHPFDGHCFANTFSIGLGLYMYGRVAEWSRIQPEWLYWAGAMWVMQVVLLPPVYARVYHATALVSRRAAGGLAIG